MKRRSMNVIFHLSEDKKCLVEVKRYVHLARVKQWCTEHRTAHIFIYCARGSESSSWWVWSHIYKGLMRVDGPTVNKFYEVLNSGPAPFGHPGTWIALSDEVHALQ